MPLVNRSELRSDSAHSFDVSVQTSNPLDFALDFVYPFKAHLRLRPSTGHNLAAVNHQLGPLPRPVQRPPLPVSYFNLLPPCCELEHFLKQLICVSLDGLLELPLGGGTAGFEIFLPFFYKGDLFFYLSEVASGFLELGPLLLETGKVKQCHN